MAFCLPSGCGAEIEAGLAEIGEVEVRRRSSSASAIMGRRSSSHLLLSEQPLLHVHARVRHVEARLARVELDHRLLPLLLLGNLLGRPVMPVSSSNSFSAACIRSRARVLHEQHVDLLALEAFPVEFGLAERETGDEWCGQGAEQACSGTGFQNPTSG